MAAIDKAGNVHAGSYLVKHRTDVIVNEKIAAGKIEWANRFIFIGGIAGGLVLIDIGQRGTVAGVLKHQNIPRGALIHQPHQGLQDGAARSVAIEQHDRALEAERH